MLTENQKKWVDALRSGDYKQAKGRLECHGSYCCLGVACLVAEQHGVPVRREGMSLYGGRLWDQKPVKECIGFLDENAILITANDRDGWSFSEIADLIESNPPGLFVEVTK